MGCTHHLIRSISHIQKPLKIDINEFPLRSPDIVPATCIRRYNIRLMATILNFTFIRMQQDSYANYVRNSGLAMSHLLANSVQVDVFSENREQLALPAQALLSQEDILKGLLDRCELGLFGCS